MYLKYLQPEKMMEKTFKMEEKICGKNPEI